MSEKKKSNPLASFGRTLKGLFVPNKEPLNVLEEEAVRTPGRTILINFFRNKLGILGLLLFVSVFLFSFIGSLIIPFNDTYTELTVSNAKPGLKYLKFPKELQKRVNDIVKITDGPTFSIALLNDGSLVMWGIENVEYRKNVSDPVMAIPEAVKNAHIVDVEAGTSFVLAVADDGTFYGWGNYGNNQTIPPDLTSWGKKLRDGKLPINHLLAQQSWGGLLTEDGYVYTWGSVQSDSVLVIPTDAKRNTVKATAGDYNILLLLKDGTVRVAGEKGTEFMASFPEALKDGSVNAVDIASTNRNGLVLDDTGKLWTWGSAQNGLNVLPEINGKVRSIGGSYRNFWAVLEDGSVIVWGANDLKQTETPKNMPPVKTVYGDYSKFYAIGEDGNIYAWGNKGYLFGTDGFGRDMLTRIIHGGRISLTVGAMAVLISVVIAMIIGMISGFYGGWVDMLLMRFTDIVMSIPFMPIAITLSAVIGHNMSSMQKLYLIMVIMGVLGWTGLARLIRASILLEREKDFVLAARALGIPQRNIIARHILPNVFNLIIVSVTLSYASSLLTEAGLSFLGYGIAEPTPSWGNMLQSAQTTTVIEFYWWRWVLPALFVIIAALSVNLVGDALREAMDPKSNDR